MTTVPHHAPAVRRHAWLEATDMWASLAITSMWVAVIFCSVFGPDITSGNGVGDVGQHTTVPSGVVVAFFAMIASWLVARHAFRHDR
jgi:hypothetical protein